MKRIAFLVLALAVAGFTGQAWAGVNGSAHDVVALIKGTNFGTCSACHIPHKAFGVRLWPAPIAGTDPLRGDVGNLCSYCHDENAGVIAISGQDQVFKDVLIADQTHGLTKSSIPEGTGSIDTTLPYGPGTTGIQALIQCTTCHNVHDQSLPGRLAFLQDDIDVLCSRCHPSRQWVGTAFATTQGAWGARLGYDPAGLAGNPGSHPVGTDITGDNSTHDIDGNGSADADSPVIANLTGLTELAIVDYGTSTDYHLGPKLINGGVPAATVFTGGIGCVTCHAVHGKDSGERSGGVDEAMPNPDVLAVNQSEQNLAANGNLDAANFLCEACHRGTANTMVSAGGYFPNPGATVAGHPMDDAGYPAAGAGVDLGTITTLGWPTGDPAGPGDPDIICESCHMPHPLAAMSNPQDNPESATNSHILRNTDNQICDNCHTGAVTNHHPINVAMDAAATGLFFDAQIGDQDAVLECSDCHNGSGAHNWSGPGAVGLDPQWEPWDNARNATDDVAGRAVADMSKECIDCHTPNLTRFSPTRPLASTEYDDVGDASHFLGPIATAGTWDPAFVNATSTPNGVFTLNNWADGGWSRFGGTTGAVANNSEMVCETCHDLEPDKNVGNNALLLHNYAEALNEPRALLCEGCHGPAGASGNAHPQTTDVVGRASLANRTPSTLLTVAGTTYAENLDRGTTFYPGTSTANQMNCNTCHQPHDAVTASGAYILESTTGVATLAEITGTPDAGITVGGRTWANRRYVAHTTPLDYQNFCNLCHASGQD
jgi:predicted CXXCH cytochrome family protein